MLVVQEQSQQLLCMRRPENGATAQSSLHAHSMRAQGRQSCRPPPQHSIITTVFGTRCAGAQHQHCVQTELPVTSPPSKVHSLCLQPSTMPFTTCAKRIREGTI